MINGQTKFQEFPLDYYNNVCVQEWHQDDETGELVIVNTWMEENETGDVEPMFDEIIRFERTACELAKINTSLNKPITRLDAAIIKNGREYE